VFVRTSIQLYKTITLMALAAILTALLPAHGTLAEDPVVALSAQELRKQIYQQWANDYDAWHTGNVPWSESVTMLNLVRDVFLVDEDLAPETIHEQLSLLQERYVKRLGENGADPAYRTGLPIRVTEEAMYAAALETPIFRESARRVYEDMRSFSQHDLTTSPISRSFHQTYLDSNLLEEAARTVAQEQHERLVKQAETNEQLAQAFDAVFAPIMGVKLEDFLDKDFDLKGFLASHPEAGVPQKVQDAIKPDGSLEISLAELQQLAKGEFATINASIDDMQYTLATLTAQQSKLVAFMNSEQKRQEARAVAEAKAKQHQLRLQAASSAVSIVSTLVSFKDPKLGKQIAVVGSSLIKVGDSLKGWMEATAGLNTLSKIGSLSTVVMTGNVLAAVMNVVSLFGPQQPTPEQMILEEIGKMRQQVDQLRTEMHTRFDQIDKQLNAIYTTMHDRFNQIDIQLGKINGSLADIQQSLLTLGITLDRMERNNFEYFDTLGRRPLREAMNGALGYYERTGLDMPYQPDFVSYENVFHTWGTINAFDPLSAGPTERNYSDEQVLAELSAAPLDANLNYLNGWLIAHGLTPFATKRLPSPRDWAFASRAYADLGQDWPEHLRRIDPQRQASLDAVGNDLQQALQNISTINTPSGPQGNAPLFTELTSYYNVKLANLSSTLAASEAAYASEVQGLLNRPVSFDLYGGVDQTLAFQPTDFGTMTCGGGYAEQIRVPAPSNLKNMVPGYNRYALADYLRLNQTVVCWYPEIVDKFDYCQNGVCEAYGFVTVEIVVKAPTGEIARRTFRGYPAKVNSDLRTLVVSQWALIYRPKIEGELVGVTPPAADMAAVTSLLVTKLSELQRTYAGRVLTELNTGALRTRAVELAGAKKLLESFITLGFPRAIASDDFLRALLFGQESLVDEQQIALAYTPRSPATPSEAELRINPRAALVEAAQERSGALAELLTAYVSSLSTQNYLEDNALIGGTRFDLTLAQAFANPSGPGQNKIIFLPLVRR
jgi:hypothetical protein